MILQLRTYWRNTNEMPFVLRRLCQGGMVACPILLFFLILPISDWTVNGQQMSYSELWRSGAGASILAFVGLGTIGCWGMAARKAWSRWALVLVPLLPTAIFPRSLMSDLGVTLIYGFLTGAIIYFCLFRLKAVRYYFETA